MTTVNDSKKSFYRNEKDYMNSYHWNYMVLELVDFIEIKLKSDTDATKPDGTKNKWRYFMEFCGERGLNRRVIKKMIEFSVGQPFDSETDLASHEKFRSLKMDDNKIVPATTSTDFKTATTSNTAPIPVAKVNIDFSVLDEMF